MGLRNVLFGRKKLSEPKDDRLFALSTARITLQTELGLKPAGVAAVTFKPISSGEFDRADADMEQLVQAAARSAGSEIERKTDEYGYDWVIVRDWDFEDVVTTVHAVASELTAQGFGSQLLAAAFRFEGGEHPVYWIYGFKLGTFWPFAPLDDEKRDNATRARAEGEAGKGASDRTGSDAVAGALRRSGLTADEPRRSPKTILVPGRDERLRAFVAENAPIPVEVVSNPAAPLGPSDLAVLVVETVEPALRAAATRVITEDVPYVVLVRRDVWSAGSDAVHKLLDEVQRDPRRKLIRFWRDRDDLERTLREDVFTLDDFELLGAAVEDGSFVKVGSTFEQAWELENSGFCTWEGRALKELASERLTPERPLVAIPPAEPGERVVVSVRFTAPDEPASCRSVWQMVGGDEGKACFPWTDRPVVPGARRDVTARAGPAPSH